MPISDLPILTMLRTRMQWHQERQRVLAENVANADIASFRPRDLTPLDFRQTAPEIHGSLVSPRGYGKLVAHARPGTGFRESPSRRSAI